ncbi:rhomboid family intramembrane serine protease [Gleimia sp. 6138-11-ORH1]|uniref:rhomboid family intramembrane serine protease n=1 Tax=Gleimia sp. 6138-11-ORH1 TaxID=2973937 RepID=UPI00216963A6|nr:rhomboid family intramembrane serine protease [Gleimia sp. 6138-11-ORH1]MCS4485118.1 rhomboid family intramembrane serine protease [Gleimia sp. 6138-11-ORH1]
MNDQPNYGQRFENFEWIACYRHPREQAISKCKRCQRNTCLTCTVPTEVATVCADCASESVAHLGVVSNGGYSSTPVKSAGQSPFSTKTWFGGGVTLTATNVLVAVITIVSLAAFVFPSVAGLLAFHPVAALSQPWRFLTVMLIHGGFVHLLFNMYSLYLVGNPLERTLGVAKYLGIFFASVFGGSLAALLWTLFTSQIAWTVGASGGIFGLFAAIFILQRQTGVDARSMGFLLVVNLIISFSFSGISWQGHLGGMLTGGLLTWLIYKFALPRPGRTVGEAKRAAELIFIGFLFSAILLLSFAVWIR